MRRPVMVASFCFLLPLDIPDIPDILELQETP